MSAGVQIPPFPTRRFEKVSQSDTPLIRNPVKQYFVIHLKVKKTRELLGFLPPSELLVSLESIRT